MPIDPTFLKVFDRVASHKFMFELLNLPPDRPEPERSSGEGHAGRWFEILEPTYEAMLDVMPPLFMRPDMFAMSELKAGPVGSVFFEITIRGVKRWFHGYCDLADRRAPDAMRSAIILWETRDTTGMSREEKLQAVWSFTSPDFKGIAGDSRHSGWPPEYRGKKTILVYEPGSGTILKLLDHLTDSEIEQKLNPRGM